MGDETVLRIKVATIASITMGLLSVAVTIMAIWLGSMSKEVNVHTSDIAVMKQADVLHAAAYTRIEAKLEDIRNEQIRRLELENKRKAK